MNAKARALGFGRWLVVGAWVASAVSRLHGEWQGWAAPDRDTHPEMPADDQDRAVAVLRACAGRVGPGDLLVVAGGDEAIEVFLRYRLAYVLYPARVVGTERTVDGVLEALGQPGVSGRRYALVLGRPELRLPGAAPLELTPRDRLFEATR